MIHFWRWGFNENPRRQFSYFHAAGLAFGLLWRNVSTRLEKGAHQKHQGTQIPKGLFAWFLDRDFLPVFVILWLVVSFQQPVRGARRSYLTIFVCGLSRVVVYGFSRISLSLGLRPEVEPGNFVAICFRHKPLQS